MAVLIPKTDIIRDANWRARVRTLPCVLTGYQWVEGSEIGVDPSHIRYGCYSAGMKPSDDLVLPLRHDLHAKSHNMGEVRFWTTYLTPELMMEALKAYARQMYREQAT